MTEATQCGDYAALVKARYSWATVIAAREHEFGGGAVVMTDYGKTEKWMLANVDECGALIDSDDELSREEALAAFNAGKA